MVTACSGLLKVGKVTDDVMRLVEEQMRNDAEITATHCDNCTKVTNKGIARPLRMHC